MFYVRPLKFFMTASFAMGTVLFITLIFVSLYHKYEHTTCDIRKDNTTYLLYTNNTVGNCDQVWQPIQLSNIQSLNITIPTTIECWVYYGENCKIYVRFEDPYSERGKTQKVLVIVGSSLYFVGLIFVGIMYRVSCSMWFNPLANENNIV